MVGKRSYCFTKLLKMVVARGGTTHAGPSAHIWPCPPAARPACGSPPYETSPIPAVPDPPLDSHYLVCMPPCSWLVGSIAPANRSFVVGVSIASTVAGISPVFGPAGVMN